MTSADDTQEIVLPAAPARVPQRQWPHLIVLHGPGVGHVYRLERTQFILGRGPGADILLSHPTVSRRHARLTIGSDRVTVDDLRSRNGTLVGIDPVKGRRAVKDGDAPG